MIVMKFGGTSVGSPQMLNRMAGLVKASLPRRPIVVVSAMAGVTDALVRLAHAAANGDLSGFDYILSLHRDTARQLGMPFGRLEASFDGLLGTLRGIADRRSVCPQDLDRVVSYGERLCSRIAAHCLRSNGVEAENFDSFDIGLITDDNFGSAEVLPESFYRIRSSIAGVPPSVTPVITGYIGRTHDGKVTTLGRGGSDYSASIIGAALCVREVQIWTDADGIMSADPKIVDAPFTLPCVSFTDASLLASFGAKIIHQKTMMPLAGPGIPARVMNTFNPDFEGTMILPDALVGSRGYISIARRALLAQGESLNGFSFPGAEGKSVVLVLSRNTDAGIWARAFNALESSGVAFEAAVVSGGKVVFVLGSADAERAVGVLHHAVAVPTMSLQSALAAKGGLMS